MRSKLQAFGQNEFWRFGAQAGNCTSEYSEAWCRAFWLKVLGESGLRVLGGLQCFAFWGSGAVVGTLESPDPEHQVLMQAV